jgi:hypothetical protein
MNKFNLTNAYVQFMEKYVLVDVTQAEFSEDSFLRELSSKKIATSHIDSYLIVV